MKTTLSCIEWEHHHLAFNQPKLDGTQYYTMIYYNSISTEAVPALSKPGCGEQCGQWCKTKLWPPMKKLLTFTVKKDSIPGTVLHLLGCLMAYLSAFTISYQVQLYNNNNMHYVYSTKTSILLYGSCRLASRTTHQLYGV